MCINKVRIKYNNSLSHFFLEISRSQSKNELIIKNKFLSIILIGALNNY